jgi:hypothetical protein
MNDAHRNSVGTSATQQSQSPKSHSPNEGTPTVDHFTIREQKKSEERLMQLKQFN